MMTEARGASKRIHILLIALGLALCSFATPGRDKNEPPAIEAIRSITFTVTSTGDASDDDADDGVCATAGGACTLRAAIQQANALGGAHTVAFALGAGIPTITAGSGLPEITATLSIDGATGGATKVELVGPGVGVGPEDSGLFFTSGGNTVKNLIINSFNGSALIFSTATGNTLEGCWLGLDASGGPAPDAKAGLFFDGSSANAIGGTTPGKGNVIDAVIFGFGSSGNTFEGNFVGTTPDGTAALGSGGGIAFVFASNGNTIGGPEPGARNVISGNGGNGIGILFGSAENVFVNNAIGTDVSGTFAIPNGADGIHIADGHANVILGNVISGNGAATTDCGAILSCDGIDIRSGSSGNVVGANHIGVDGDGTLALGNRDNGVFLGDGAASNSLGGAEPEERNVISGNGGNGVLIAGGTTVANTVAGNRIGTNAAGTAPIPNVLHGVFVFGGVGNGIGGEADGAGNTIAFNGGAGVFVEAGEGIIIRRNAIKENGQLGIDLGDPGPTPNDPGDTDGGANALQNAPLVTSVEPAGGSTLISFTLNSLPEKTYTVEFFGSEMRDPSGFGEGETYLDAASVTTNDKGTVSDFITLAGTHEIVTATATDEDGNTSEFSGLFTFHVNSTADANDLDPDDGVCDTGGVITRDFVPEIECTLRAAITHVTAHPDDKEITFNIPVQDDDGCDGDVCTIALDALLPGLTVPSMSLDALTQPGACGGGKNGCTPKVVLDGSEASSGENAHGLNVKAAGVSIKGLVIQNFAGRGILIEGVSGTTIAANYLGTNATGTAAAPNDGGGILILNAAGNTIGGTTDDDRNVISGNRHHGVEVSGTSARQNNIWGNFIGTDASGTEDLGNEESGVALVNGAQSNQVGGGETGQRNVLSGNDDGVSIAGSTTKDNTVRGNYVGLDASGTEALGNDDGISISDAPDNEIGGGETGQRNVISANVSNGVSIFGKAATGNAIRGNFIGTGKDGACTLDAQSLCPLSNATGVWISGAPGNEVGGPQAGMRNVIGGGSHGVVIIGSEAAGNKILGNFIGTDATGLEGLSNSTGVTIQDAPDNEVGGAGEGLGNVVSGNRGYGVVITGGDAHGNTVRGNLIGLDKDGGCVVDANGFCSLRNTDGVLIDAAAHDNVLGGAEEGAGNVISGNLTNGLIIRGDETEGNKVQGNLIGLAPDGDALRGNGGHGIYLHASGNAIGGTGEKDGNVISGNAMNGLLIEEATGTLVQGNFIGTDATGTRARGNGHNGIALRDIFGEEDADLIGGLRELFSEDACPPPCNIIAGNGTAGEEGETHGIRLENTRSFAVQGNLIGAGIGGAKLGNAGAGLYLYDSSFNTIGQDAFDYDPALNGRGNVIANNDSHGIQVAETGDEKSHQNSILSNRFFGNAGLGIDLKGGGDPASGVTPNDATLNSDADAGPNDLQNYPDIVSLTRKDETTMTLAVGFPFGTDPGRRGRRYVFEYFASPMADPSGHGEGRTFVAGREPTIPSNHNLGLPFGFSLDLPVASIRCSFISVTATDDDGNTSEFSKVKANLVGCLQVEKIDFEHRLPGGTEPLTDGATVDGNLVKINVHVRNGGEDDVQARVQIRETADNIEIIRPGAPGTNLQTFPAGETTVVSYDWDTMGYAWKKNAGTPLSGRTIEVTLLDPDLAEAVDEKEEPLVVRPRPVILVHGLWNDAAVWNDFKAALAEVRSDHPWNGFAVGDGGAPGLLITGANPSTYGLPTLSMTDNARRLDQYIEAVRGREKAAHVDVIAEGSGGLITRQYITSVMPAAPAGDAKPTVTNLVMLGTPNLGAACADDLLFIPTLPRRIGSLIRILTAGITLQGVVVNNVLSRLEEAVINGVNRHLSELRTDFVNQEFNPAQEQKEVPFYAFAGDGVRFTCSRFFFGEQGDGFVERSSVLANKTFGQRPVTSKPPVITGSTTSSRDVHFVMPFSQNAFDYATSVLNTYPGEQPDQRGGQAGAAPLADAASKDALQEEPQYVIGLPMPVPRGETVELGLPVPEAAAFGMTVVASDSVTSILRDPSGNPVDEAPMGASEAVGFMRVHSVNLPTPGAWTLELTYHGGLDTAFVPVTAWVLGSTLRLDLDLATPDASNRIQVQASLTDDATPVPGATVFANFFADGDTTDYSLELFDDGQHGDGEAGDGRYGALSSTLPAGTYTAGAWAAIDDQLRTAMHVVTLGEAGTAHGADLALRVDDAVDSDGGTVTFTLAVTNTGPDPATDVTLDGTLPPGSSLDAITPSQGTCAADDGIRCDLDELAAGAGAVVVLVLSVSDAALLSFTANVAGNESDWNAGNNTATTVVVLGTLTAAEDAADDVPDAFALHANYPNPFNPRTEIGYGVRETTHVLLQVFNAVGQPVATLADALHVPGRYTVTFEAEGLPSGVYFYRIRAGAFQAVQKMVLIK